MRAMMFAVAMLVTPLVARADVPPEATALFDQGIKDLQAGNTAIACKELAASLAQYPDSGTKGALAECYTKIGKVVSAWNLWRDLADTAPSAEDKNDAAGNAYKLEARLPHFVIRLRGAPVAGLAVVVENNPVSDPTLAVPLPIDPGTFTVHASAPDYNDWTQAFQANEGKLTVVEIPALVAKPKPKPVVSSMPTTGPATVIVREDSAATRHSRHVIGISLGLVGLVAAGVGTATGLSASSKWNKAKNDCQGNIDVCPQADLMQAQSDVNSARTSALVSTIGVGVGGAALLVGAIVFFSAPSAETSSTQARLQLAPSLDPRAPGFALSGRW